MPSVRASRIYNGIESSIAGAICAKINTKSRTYFEDPPESGEQIVVTYEGDNVLEDL